MARFLRLRLLQLLVLLRLLQLEAMGKHPRAPWDPHMEEVLTIGTLRPRLQKQKRLQGFLDFNPGFSTLKVIWPRNFSEWIGPSPCVGLVVLSKVDPRGDPVHTAGGCGDFFGKYPLPKGSANFERVGTKLMRNTHVRHYFFHTQVKPSNNEKSFKVEVCCSNGGPLISIPCAPASYGHIPAGARRTLACAGQCAKGPRPRLARCRPPMS